jgi:hypothetical protein
LDYDMSDKYTLTPKIKEDIEFQRGIIVKLKPRKNSSVETELISSVWTHETNTFLHLYFCKFVHLYNNL